MSNLEQIYSCHHQQERGKLFVVFGKERGELFKSKIGKNKRVLDMGCRDGALTKYFLENNNIIGTDIDGQALEVANRNLKIETKQLDLNGQWGLSDNEFDAVVAAEILEHLYYPEQILNKVCDVLKPEGVFLGSVPNVFNLKNRFRLFWAQKEKTPLADPTHINHFSRQELKKLLEKKFKQVKIYPLGNYAFLDKFFPGLFSYLLLFEAREKK